MQLEYKGRPKIIASDITSRLLYNLTAIYIIDHLIYKKDELKNELITQVWGKTTNLKNVI